MVGEREPAIQVVVILASEVSLEVVAGYNLVGVEEDLNGVIDW